MQHTLRKLKQSAQTKCFQKFAQRKYAGINRTAAGVSIYIIYTYIQCMYKQDLWNRQLTTRSVPLHGESVTNQHSLHFRCSSMCLALAQIWGVRLDSPYDNVSILANTSKFWKSSADMASLLACRAPTKSSWTSYKKI